VLKLAHNELDESVFGSLAEANFTNIEELDVSWNRLQGMGGARELEKLKMLDVSGHGETIDAM
jgi:hypothetical protein